MTTPTLKTQNYLRALAFGVLVSFTFTACEDDDDDNDPDPELEVPATYVSADFETNAATEIGVIDETGALSSAMKGADGGNAVLTSDLLGAWDGTTLKAVTVSYYSALINGWLPELAASSGGDFDPFTAPTGDGGYYGSHTFDENGLELEQMVEKGLFAAAHYNHALTILNSGSITAEDIDKLVAIYGATPNFPNDSGSDVEGRDRFTAQYTERRTAATDTDGLYYQIQNNLITAKAAAEQGFDTERDAALAEFQLNWEKAIMATVIYYLNATVDGVLNGQTLADAAQESAYADALHAYGEGVGFLHGWYGIAESEKQISNAQIDALLTLMKAPRGATPESYKIVTEPGGAESGNLADLRTAIDDIQALYGFSDAEVESFYTNF